MVLNGTTVVLRENDPVDLDANGQFDDNLFIHTFGNDDAFLTDDGWLYFVASLRNMNGTTAVADVFLRVKVF
jgi:hypothetical protein